MSHTKASSGDSNSYLHEGGRRQPKVHISLRECLQALKNCPAFRGLSYGRMDVHARVNSSGQRWPSLKYAQERASIYKASAERSKSDSDYWGVYVRYQYWGIVATLYEAADLVGDDRLSNARLPDENGSYPQWSSYASAAKRSAKRQARKRG